MIKANELLGEDMECIVCGVSGKDRLFFFTILKSKAYRVLTWPTRKPEKLDICEKCLDEIVEFMHHRRRVVKGIERYKERMLDLKTKAFADQINEDKKS